MAQQVQLQQPKHLKVEYPMLVMAAILAVIAGIAIFFFGSHIGQTLSRNESEPNNMAMVKASPESGAGLANPAAVYCANLGGTTSNTTAANGGQIGICTVNGMQCDEWALFRGTCSVSPSPKQSVVPISSAGGSMLANPASVNCTKQGGTLAIQTRGDGGQYGLCNFQDGYACEEWALLRGDCKKPGVKTTGFDNQAEMYCAWLGGKTLAVKNATCTFNDGSVCNDQALYDGQCHKGQF